MSTENNSKEVADDPFAEAEVTFEGERPWVNQSSNAPKFRANDTVLVNLGAGTVRCIVVKVNAHLKPPTYVLEKEDGTVVNQAVAEASIRSAS